MLNHLFYETFAAAEPRYPTYATIKYNKMLKCIYLPNPITNIIKKFGEIERQRIRNGPAYLRVLILIYVHGHYHIGLPSLSIQGVIQGFDICNNSNYI